MGEKENRSHDAYRSGVSKRHAHAGKSLAPSWLMDRKGISQIRKIVNRDFIDSRRFAPPTALLVDGRTES
jgi:hypothetical protein